MADKPVYLTSEGKKKLEEELEYLVTIRRREVAEAIQGKATLNIESKGVFFVELMFEGKKYWQGKLVRI